MSDDMPVFMDELGVDDLLVALEVPVEGDSEQHDLVLAYD